MTNNDAQITILESLRVQSYLLPEFLSAKQIKSGIKPLTYARLLIDAWQFYWEQVDLLIENYTSNGIIDANGRLSLIMEAERLLRGQTNEYLSIDVLTSYEFSKRDFGHKDLAKIWEPIKALFDNALQHHYIDENVISISDKNGSFELPFSYAAVPENLRTSFSRWFEARNLNDHELQQWAIDYKDFIFIGRDEQTTSLLLRKGIEWATIHLNFWAKADPCKEEWLKSWQQRIEIAKDLIRQNSSGIGTVSVMVQNETKELSPDPLSPVYNTLDDIFKPEYSNNINAFIQLLRETDKPCINEDYHYDPSYKNKGVFAVWLAALYSKGVIIHPGNRVVKANLLNAKFPLLNISGATIDKPGEKATQDYQHYFIRRIEEVKANKH